MTGESLPVDKAAGDLGFSGSVVRQGEMSGLVVATGGNTFFGRTAQLVAGAKSESHFQRAILSIGDYLIYLSLGLVAALVVVELFRGTPFLELAQFALILTVASIPVAMPAVLSVTMAIGAMVLARMKAIVARLESIEEMAGMDVLCSDKTGTLTMNELKLGEPVLFARRRRSDPADGRGARLRRGQRRRHRPGGVGGRRGGGCGGERLPARELRALRPGQEAQRP